MSVAAAVAEVERTLNLSSPSSQIKATLLSEEPRSTTKPPSLEALVPEPAPLERFMMLSVTSMLVVFTEVVVPLTVKLPLNVALAAEMLPLNEAELPSEAREPA